jgi:ADP-ribose pyrophosphatase
MMNQEKWELIKTQKVFDSNWLSLESRSYKLPSGLVKSDYLHLNRPDYVLIAALNESNQLMVERQYRRGVDDFVYELPAGWIEKDESPIEAAKRELLEETGIHAVGNTYHELYPQPGFCSMKAYVCVLTADSVKEPRLGDGENISTEWLSLDEVRQMIMESKIKDMGFLSALSFIKT